MNKLNKIKNYFVFTFSFEGGPLALKLQDEGKNVILAVIDDYKDCYTKNEKHKPEDPEEKKLRLTSFDGMVKKLDANKAVEALIKVPESERSSYFLFFDFNHCFKFAEKLAGKGFNGNFPTEEDRTMEVDRAMAKKIVEDNYDELEVAENEEFKKAEDGIKFLEDSDDLWVLKGFDEDAETVVPDEDNKDEIELCKKQIINKLQDDSAMYEKSGFTLEKYIPDIIELTPEIQFYDGKPIFATLDIELKRIGNKNTGFMTGCAGDLVFEIPMDSELIEMSFPKFVYDLAKKHNGWFVWDASLLFDKDGNAYFGEYCANRCGYNAIYTILAHFPTVSEFFEAIVDGKNPFENSAAEFATSLRLFNTRKKVRSIDYNDEIKDDVWLMDARKDGDRIKSVGYLHDLAVITGLGDTVEEAAENMYDNVSKFSFSGKVYRTDFLDDFNGSITRRYAYYENLG